MLATDNHIGYLERDPVRGQDAMDTFEEILKLAVKYDVGPSTNCWGTAYDTDMLLKVDFILLAGDLFHENRPSREVLFRTMALLREHTLSDKPVQVELLSNPEDGKADGFRFVLGVSAFAFLALNPLCQLSCNKLRRPKPQRWHPCILHSRQPR